MCFTVMRVALLAQTVIGRRKGKIEPNKNESEQKIICEYPLIGKRKRKR